MKTITAALFAVATLIAATPSGVMAKTTLADLCDAGSAPAGWARPGGFCDQNDLTKSLSDPNNSDSCSKLVTVAALGSNREVGRMLVAIPATQVCCEVGYYQYLDGKERVVVAASPCGGGGGGGGGGGCSSLRDDMLPLQNEFVMSDRMMLVAC